MPVDYIYRSRQNIYKNKQKDTETNNSSNQLASTETKISSSASNKKPRVRIQTKSHVIHPEARKECSQTYTHVEILVVECRGCDCIGSMCIKLKVLFER